MIHAQAPYSTVGKLLSDALAIGVHLLWIAKIAQESAHIYLGRLVPKFRRQESRSCCFHEFVNERVFLFGGTNGDFHA